MPLWDKLSGRIDLPHPWFDVFVPDSVIDAYADPILAALTPDDLGPDFPILFIPIKTNRITRPLLRMPDEPVAFLFDILSTAPDAAAAAQMVARNRTLFEAARNLAGIHQASSTEFGPTSEPIVGLASVFVRTDLSA